MAKPSICSKCRTNEWKVSLGERKQIFFTCAKCGNTFTIEPPNAKQLLEMNKPELQEYIKKLVKEEITDSKVSERVNKMLNKHEE